MRATTRVGASICLSVFSLVSIILLLPSSQLSTQLQKITLGTTLDEFPTLWNWGADTDEKRGGDGVRLVVFGDSWVDNSLDKEKGRGLSWPEVLCREINCTSYLSFAASQAVDSYPSSAPAGVITSNAIYAASLAASSSPPLEPLSVKLLPDLAAQIQTFIALPPPSPQPEGTLFVISFGIWDIYSFAGLDYALGKNVTDKTVNELFSQLDILYSHYSQILTPAHITGSSDGSTNTTNTTEAKNHPHNPPPFHVIITKLFEPTLLPGWISQRPVPLRPSSVAENQKNAAYLSSRWNTLTENRISSWLKEAPLPLVDITSNTTEELASPPNVERDVFYYDVAQYLLDIIVEHQLEDEGISDARGLGKGDSPFESVYEPCLREVGTEDELVDLNGLMVCKKPEDYLFWDGFSLGSVAKEGIGKGIGAAVKQGKSMNHIWAQKEG